MKKTTNKTLLAGAALLMLLMASACGNQESAGGNQAGSAHTGINQAGNGQTGNTQAGNAQAGNAESGNAQSGNAESGNAQTETSSSPQAGQNGASTPAEPSTEASASNILIIIDQTPKPTTETRSFDFSIQKVPEGYALKEMQWVSDKNTITSTPQEAIQNGQSGEDGFYISGNGQFSGFFYPEDMKGEQGQVIFKFQNDQGNELSWKKELKLK